MRRGDDARGDDAARGGDTTRTGGRRVLEKTSAGTTTRGGEDAGHSLTHECAPHSAAAAFSSDVL